MWGGMMCPLIPLMKRLPRAWRSEFATKPTTAQITEGYLHFFEPDAFVETSDGQIDSCDLSPTRPWRDRSRFQNFEKLISTEPGREPSLGLGVSMHHAYNHLYHTEFQFQRRGLSRSFVFDGGDRIARAFFEVCYGLFPEDMRIDYIERTYRGAIEPEILTPSAQAWLEIEDARHAECPLDFTIRRIDQRFSGGWNANVFIFDPMSGPDVVDFWNARLFKRDILPVNVHWLEESREVIAKAIRRNFRPLPSNPYDVMIRTTINCGRSLDLELIRDRLDLKSLDLPDHSYGLSAGYPEIWMPRDPYDETIRVGPASLIAKSVEVQDLPSDGENPSIQIPLLSPDFVEFTRGAGAGWVNVIEPHIYSDHASYAQAMPSAALARSDDYPLKLGSSHWPTREGHISVHQFSHGSQFFTLQSHRTVITAWLKSQGIEATPSDAGRVADQLIQSARGLHRTVLLAHPEAVRRFDDMARSRTVRTDGNSEEYPERTATVAQLETMVRQIKRKLWGSHVTLDSYVKAGVLRLGISVSCQHCTKENWYSLDDIAETVKCERCLKHFDFPQGARPSKDAWKYRVIGPFATPHFAQGAYSVALTLRFLQHQVRSMSAMTWTTSLDLRKGDEKLETDFFMWHAPSRVERDGEEPALIVGECKSFGVDLFKAKDVDRLKRLGEMLPDAILVAAALKQDFSPDEVKRLRNLCKWGWKQRDKNGSPTRVLVLTGHELFAIGPLSNAWKDAGGHLAKVEEEYRNIFDFDKLAQATQQAHLGFTSDEMLRMRYPEPKIRRPRKG
ncbi:MAG: hypothetical protein BGP16_05705 [Sphingobium sp. 66-54]|nr:MAG: hypothetical protein BGP16_05705 [Sphingobium sp. 66-54]